MFNVLAQQPSTGATITAMTNTITPERAHDERYVELMLATFKAEQSLGWALDRYRRESLARTDRRQRWGVKDDRSINEIADDMQARRVEAREFWTARGDDPADAEHMTAYAIGELDKVENGYTEALAVAIDARSDEAAHETNYTGWQRFFLVTSSAGLVHRDMYCSTCNKGRSATTFALLPTLSGQPVAALVEALGPVLCSVCFKDAPVAWTDEERIPARVAQVLLDNGAEAFTAALTEFKNKRAARAAKKGSQS